MSTLARHFLGWDKPVLETTVAFLAQGWQDGGALDLSDQLVVVPTRQAGRRLREALARHAATREAAVRPPLVVTPDYLFSPSRLEDAGLPVATPQTAHLLWTALLLRLSLDDYRRVFPVDPVERDLPWAAGQARELLAVRDLLVESGLDFHRAAERFAEVDIEAARWRELAALEAAALRHLRDAGFADPGQAALQAAKAGLLPGTVKRLVVAAVPDLRPLATRALAHYAEAVPVAVLVSAPASEADAFDPFGRPLPDAWLEREIAFEDPDRRLHPCAGPAAQAERCRDLLAPYADPAACAAIGLPDPAVAPTLEQRLAAAGLSTYDPAGRPVSREGVVHLLRLLHELVATERYTTFRQLLRCPGFAEAVLSEEGREAFRSGWLLNDSDRVASDHFPADLDGALAILRRNPSKAPLLAAALEGVRTLLARLRKDGFTDELCQFLSAVFGSRRFDPHDPATAVLVETADAIHSLESDLASVAAAFPRLPAAEDRLRLLLDSLAERRVHPERAPLALDLQGWLELLWEDAPHLVVAGMNDPAVPEALVGHAFLPDTARTLLGVPDNEARFARDAFLLTVLVETRRKSGRLDLLFGRLDASGDPLRPSRLLFQCRDDELAARTLRLFRESDGARIPPARTVAWRLKPAPLPSDHRLFQRISITGFKGYLACPFRFYLKHGLGMETVETDKAELDSLDFGNLVHAALEAYGGDESLRRSTEAAAIAAAFESGIDRWLAQRFGPRLSTPLLIQREAAKRRLAHWAEIEAAQRAAGWEILEVEAELGKEGWPFEIGGMPVTGRIDRIERHPAEGLRVVDFKTLSPMEGGRIKTVDRYHLAGLRRSENPASFPDWALLEDGKGKRSRWTDLQVPLYHLALSERFPGEAIVAGYVTLGRTAEEVRLDLWAGLDEATLESARNCAVGVVEAIRQEIFWPPNERMPEWDEFHRLLSPTAEEAVDARGLNAASAPP